MEVGESWKLIWQDCFMHAFSLTLQTKKVLNTNSLNSYHFFTVPFCSKIPEKNYLAFILHCTLKNLIKLSWHNTVETMLNDAILMQVSTLNGQVSIFILLGQSAAFDRADYFFSFNNISSFGFQELMFSSFSPTSLITVSFFISFFSFLLPNASVTQVSPICSFLSLYSHSWLLHPVSFICCLLPISISNPNFFSEL